MNNSGKTHGCLIAAIVFLLVIILAMAAIFIIFFARRPDTPDVHDILAEVESSERTTDNDSSLTDVINIQAGGPGITEITMSLTNADLTALANDYADSSDDIPFNNLLLNCNEDETIDITGVIEDLSVYADSSDVPALVGSILKSAEGKRLYATIFITYRGSNEFDIAIENIRIERFNIPLINSLFGPMADNIESMLQEQLDAYDQFLLQEFKIEENLLTFKGELTE